MKWLVSLLTLGIVMLTIICMVMPFASPTYEKRASRNYQRVVALAPSMSETIEALGQAHRLVGVTTHCRGSNFDHLPKIGSFGEPNFEAIMALDPDLVVAVPHVMARPIIERLRQNHIEVFDHQPDSLADIRFVITALASTFGVAERGAALNQQIDHALRYAQEKLKPLRQHSSLTALIAVSSTPLVVAGPTTFPSEIIAAVGLSNLARDKTAVWPIWSLEQLIHTPPKVMIITNEEQLPEFLRLIRSLNITAHHFRLLVPKRPIFDSPSPLIIADIYHLADLLPPEL